MERVQDPLSLVDRNMQDAATAYQTFVTDAEALREVTRSWYRTHREAKGEPGEAALSDEHHGYWRGISREVYDLGFRTLRQAFNDAWPLPADLQPERPGGGGGLSPFPPEFGRVTRGGQHFFREDGSVFDWRGVTAFMAFARFRNGEDLTPMVNWWRAVGFNVLRVFVAGTNWPSSYYGYVPHYTRPFDDPHYQQQLDAFYRWCAGEGFRVESTVCTYQIDSATWRRAAQMVFDVAQHHWNASFVEAVNEPWVGHGSPEEIFSGVNRHGILSAYGWQPTGNPDDTWTPCPTLDYLTPHTPRDMPHFAHNGKDLMGVSDTGNCPAVDDEPCGVAEFEKGSPGQRTNNRDNVVSHFACSRLFGGATLHYHEGIPTTLPGPTTDLIAHAVADVWRFFPPEAVLGSYTRAGLHDFPLEWADSDTGHPSSKVDHAYATILGAHAWAINCLPTDGWGPVARNGWVVESSTADGLVALRR